MKNLENLKLDFQNLPNYARPNVFVHSKRMIEIHTIWSFSFKKE